MQRDVGMRAVLTAVGGIGKLADALGVKRQSIEWTTVPQRRLFEVARVANLDPVEIRPDLADWIIGERRSARMALARSHFSMAQRAMTPRLGDVARRINDEVATDMLTTLAACRFIAAEKGLAFAVVLVGKDRDAAAARSLAMALARVAGRAQSSNVAAVFGTSRQNVDNCCERYLRSRDGDDPEDFTHTGADGQGRVVERGRVRRAKAAAEDLWALEKRFGEIVAGEERKSA